MSRNTVHFAIDTLLFMAILGLVMTGLLLAFVLPPGQGGAQAWGLFRHQWGDIHYWIALSMLTLALLHVALNWPWVCRVATQLVCPKAQALPGWRQYLAALLLIGVLLSAVGGFLWLAAGAKTAGGGGPGDGWRGQGHHGGR